MASDRTEEQSRHTCVVGGKGPCHACAWLDSQADEVPQLQRDVQTMGADLIALTAAVARMAAYQGVAHLLKDPKV